MSNYGRSNGNQGQQSQHIDYPLVKKSLSAYFNDAKDLCWWQ